jgi:hypothetical protein
MFEVGCAELSCHCDAQFFQATHFFACGHFSGMSCFVHLGA